MTVTTNIAKEIARKAQPTTVIDFGTREAFRFTPYSFRLRSTMKLATDFLWRRSSIPPMAVKNATPNGNQTPMTGTSESERAYIRGAYAATHLCAGYGSAAAQLGDWRILRDGWLHLRVALLRLPNEYAPKARNIRPLMRKPTDGRVSAPAARSMAAATRKRTPAARHKAAIAAHRRFDSFNP